MKVDFLEFWQRVICLQSKSNLIDTQYIWILWDPNEFFSKSTLILNSFSHDKYLYWEEKSLYEMPISQEMIINIFLSNLDQFYVLFWWMNNNILETRLIEETLKSCTNALNTYYLWQFLGEIKLKSQLGEIIIPSVDKIYTGLPPRFNMNEIELIFEAIYRAKRMNLPKDINIDVPTFMISQNINMNIFPSCYYNISNEINKRKNNSNEINTKRLRFDNDCEMEYEN